MAWVLSTLADMIKRESFPGLAPNTEKGRPMTSLRERPICIRCENREQLS